MTPGDGCTSGYPLQKTGTEMARASKTQTIHQEMTVFELALSLPEEEREAYVRQACGGDSQLIARILDRLNWERKMAGFLTTPLMVRDHEDFPFQPGQIWTAASRSPV